MTEYNIKVHSATHSIYECKEVPVPNTDYCKLVSRCNQVAILINPNYGSGWYTSNSEHGAQFCKDSRIIRYTVDSNYRDQFWNIEHFFAQIGITGAYLDGFGDVVVEFVPVNTLFRIVEYDGAESIEIYDPNLFMMA